MEMPVHGDFDLVYFHAILSDNGPDGEILQITAIQRINPFSVCIRPSKPIPSTALPSSYGLRLENSDFFFHDQKLWTVDLGPALVEFLEYLQALPKRVLLVGHSEHYMFMHLLRAIRKTGMIHSFAGCIAGFIDTVDIFRQNFPNRGEFNEYTLPVLCRDFLYEYHEEHPLDGVYALQVLKELVTKEITQEELSQASRSYSLEMHQSLSKMESSANAEFLCILL